MLFYLLSFEKGISLGQQMDYYPRQNKGRKVKQFVFIICWGCCLIGCTLGPDFKPPCSPKTTSYTESQLSLKTIESKGQGGKAQNFIAGGDIPSEWWRLFHSPTLNNLIIKALKNNQNLQAAQAAWRQAEGGLRASTAFLFPMVSFESSAQRMGFNGAQFGPDNVLEVPSSTFNLYNTSVNVAYDLDFFGKNRRQIEASVAQLDYQRFIVEATFLTLTSNIVTSAITEASLQAQIQETNQLILLQESMLRVMEKKLQVGTISHLDILAQQTQLTKTQEFLPPLQKALAQTRHTLSVLIGELPSESKLPVFNLTELELPLDLPVSLPSCFVRQRPDVRAAEEFLHATSAQIGIAKANFFPQITLAASYGFSSNVLNGFFDPQNTVWNVMGSLLQPIFQGGALEAKYDIAIAAFEQAFAQYRQTVLQAFKNVADTLRALELDAKQLYLQTKAEDAAWKTFVLTQKQYQVGTVSYLSILDAERQLLEARMSRIQAQANRYADTAALFQALGGGWWNRNLVCEMMSKNDKRKLFEEDL